MIEEAMFMFSLELIVLYIVSAQLLETINYESDSRKFEVGPHISHICFMVFLSTWKSEFKNMRSQTWQYIKEVYSHSKKIELQLTLTHWGLKNYLSECHEKFRNGLKWVENFSQVRYTMNNITLKLKLVMLTT